MKPQQILPPSPEEFQAYCLGKVDLARAREIEAYLTEGSACTPLLDATPEDPLLRHLRGARELAGLSTPLPAVPPPAAAASGLRYASYSADGKDFSISAYRPGQLSHVHVYATAGSKLKGRVIDRPAPSLHLSPHARRLVLGLNPCRAEVWDLEHGWIQVTIAGHRHEVVTSAFRPDGCAVLTASNDGRVRVSSFPDGQQASPFVLPVTEPALKGPQKKGGSTFFLDDGVRCLAVSPDGKWLFVGGWDQNGFVLDAAKGSVHKLIEGHKHAITAATFTLDGKQLLTGSIDRTVCVWEVGSWRRQHEWPSPTPVRYFSLSPDGSLALVGTRGSAQLLRLKEHAGAEGKNLWQRLSRSGAFLPDSKGALFGQLFGVNRWDRQTRKTTPTPLHHTSSVSAIAVDAQGKRVATGAWAIGQIWDLQTGNPIGLPLQQNGDYFKTLAFSPNGRLLASLMFKGNVRFWDAATGRAVGPVLRHPGVGNALVFHPNGSMLLTGSSDAVVHRWYVPRPVTEKASLLKLRTEVLTGMELDPDGVVRILSPETWQQRRQRLEQLAPGTVRYLKPDSSGGPGVAERR